MPLPPLSPLISSAAEVFSAWPEVKARPVFGCHGFIRAGKMFAFVWGDGVAVKASGALAEELYARPGVVAFAYNEKPMTGWPVLPLVADEALDDVVEVARRAYDSVGASG
jgi:TfoX/Sxy family transcriptional regulator of competence genes